MDKRLFPVEPAMVRFPPAPPLQAPKWSIWYPGVPIEWCQFVWVRQPEGSFYFTPNPLGALGRDDRGIHVL